MCHHVSSCAITQLDQEGGLHFPLPVEARTAIEHRFTPRFGSNRDVILIMFIPFTQK